MGQSISIDFKILVGDNEDDWISVTDLLGESAFLVDYYSSLDQPYCCNFQGGFFIDIDGQPWSDDGHVDELLLTATWFTALKQLLLGHALAKAHPWEESRLTLKRQDNVLIMEDIHNSGHIAMPKVAVSCNEFIQQIIAASLPFTKLVKEVAAEIGQRRVSGISTAVEEKFREIENHLLLDFTHDIDELATILKADSP